jgi:hypothetical protein
LQIIDEADTLLKIDYIRSDELLNNSELKRNIEIDGKIIYEKPIYELELSLLNLLH